MDFNARRREGMYPPILAALKRFGMYKGEIEQKSREFKLTSSPGLESIMGAWMRILNFPEMRQLFHCTENTVYHSRESIQGATYTAQDITDFSIGIKAFKDFEAFRAAGPFLSTLINESDEASHVIILEGHDTPIDCIGYQNKKDIIIQGDPGRWLGAEMLGGSILVKGNTDDEAGADMRAGDITIEGGAGSNVGQNMAGGTIMVKGNVRKGLGICMYGGRIQVIGNAGDRPGDTMRGGEIVILGNAGNCIGVKMKHGRIVVHGNAGNSTGGHEDPKSLGFQNPFYSWSNPMDTWQSEKDGTSLTPKEPPNDGEIIIHGDVGQDAGHNMDGSTLRIDGGIKSLGRIIKGRIYHRGRLIF